MSRAESSPADPSTLGRRYRFRRRLLAVLLLAGLAPLIVLTVFSNLVIGRFTSLSLAELDETLDKVGREMNRRGAEAGVGAELEQAQLNLAMAEVARPKAFARVRFLFIVFLAASAALLTAVAVLLGRAVSRPIERLTTGMLRFAQGELDHRLPERPTGRPDELELLVRQFNRMGAELAAQRERLAVTEKLAAWQDVARAMAHDLGNPLTAMKMALGRLARAEGDGGSPASGASLEARRESVALIEDEVAVLHRMTQSFSAFAKLPPPVMAVVDLAALLKDVCALYREGAGVKVEYSGPATLGLRGDGDQLRRAFGNLVKNAVEASAPEDGAVVVELRAESSRALVRVSDRGQGIHAPIEGAALTRSLGSTKAGGSGLGLPISHKIVHDHGGALRLAPRAERGTEALVDLPLPPSLPAGSAAAAKAS